DESEGDIAIVVYETSVMALDTITEKDKFPGKCLIVGFLPLALAKQLKGTPKSVDVWDIVAVLPSSNMKRDMAFIKSKYSHQRHASLPNLFYMAVTHFMTLMKLVVSAHMNTLSTSQMIDINALSQVETLRGQVSAYDKERFSLKQEIQKVSETNTAIALENEELRKELSRLKRKLSAKDRSGYVYLLKVKNRDDVYKIGRTKNPDNRLRTFSVKLPFPVDYEHLIQCDDMYALESELHARYADQRLDGEFFRLTPTNVQAIKTIGDE
ncbi:MAG: GIY-YIG nuclease family protein, partial [Chloroflexota bacterium]